MKRRERSERQNRESYPQHRKITSQKRNIFLHSITNFIHNSNYF